MLFAGDEEALFKSGVQIRTEFEKNRSLENEAEIQEALRGIEEVRELLAENIVQGKLNERDNYEVEMKPVPGGGNVFEPTPIDAVELGDGKAEKGCDKK